LKISPGVEEKISMQNRPNVKKIRFLQNVTVFSNGTTISKLQTIKVRGMGLVLCNYKDNIKIPHILFYYVLRSGNTTFTNMGFR
jgi:hypothetical protein